MTTTRRLYLLRHAQAQPSGPSDHQRPLDAQGEADAAALGDLLTGRALPLMRVFASDAARTRGTWSCLQSAGLRAEVRFEAALYNGGEDAYLAVAEPRDAHDIMIIGHNPVIARVAARLAKGGEPSATAQLARGFPTASCAVLRFDGDASPQDGFLEEFLVPPHRPR